MLRDNAHQTCEVRYRRADITLAAMNSDAFSCLYRPNLLSYRCLSCRERIDLSLGLWAQESISLRFEFDSVDHVSNDFLGVQLDAIEVGQLCP